MLKYTAGLYCVMIGYCLLARIVEQGHRNLKSILWICLVCCCGGEEEKRGFLVYCEEEFWYVI